MPRNNHKSHRLMLRMTILIALILLILFGWIVCTLKTAERHFGHANEHMSLFSKIRYAHSLNRNVAELQQPVVFIDGLDRKFVVEQDESAQNLCQRLFDEGFVRDRKTTCQLMTYLGRDRSIQPGSYTIPSGITSIEMTKIVGNPRYRDIELRIYAGWRLEEIATSIDLLGFSFNGSDFLALAKHPSQNLKEQFPFIHSDGLQGYLLAGLYSFKPDITLEETLAILLGEFEAKVIKSELKTMLENNGLNLHEGLTMASIIQRETLAIEEMPLMASVFYNRLKLGMKLETDVTVQYAVGWYPPQETWWKTQLTWDDLSIASPYNTYNVYGLPPGPICNSGIEVIRAVAQPEDSEYIFFRAACDGASTHNFSITYEEHLNKGCE